MKNNRKPIIISSFFSAMSAKTESNMNILNVYKGKDLYNEPMRKRSSSATEASKPINVLQKRQNPIEIRNSFSPQYNSKCKMLK